ncbi:hypothetical protein ACFLX4_00120 [Chloroflexota bacterium]
MRKLKLKTGSLPGRFLRAFICVILLLSAGAAVVYAETFVLPSTITIDGTFTDWGTTGSPTAGAYLFQDASNTGAQDASVAEDTLEDLNWFWTAVSTEDGGDTPATSTNLIQDFYYRIDSWGDSDFNPTQSYYIQLNCGTAPDGYADHILQINGYENNTPVVTLVLYEYETPYPKFRAFTTGTIVGRVSNVALPYPQFTGAHDATAAGARELYDGTHYGIELNIPVDWFGLTYGGSIKNDGTGPNLVASTVFSSTGTLGSVGTVRDTLNDGDDNTVITETDVEDGDTDFDDVTWKSYDTSSYIPPEIDSFTDYSTQNIVYMFGVGFTPSTTTTYRVVFWDGAGNNVEVEDTTTDSDGYMSAQHTFADPDTAGNWHCTVYDVDDNPSYTPTSYALGLSEGYMVADDTSYTGGYAFNVEGTAIPEIPTVVAGIAIAGLCFGIYYWMRRRRACAQT